MFEMALNFACDHDAVTFSMYMHAFSNQNSLKKYNKKKDVSYECI